MIINLISGPRNISTALMYSFAQRSDTKVVDEPLYGYYLNQTGLDHPGREEILKSMPINYEDVLDQLNELDRQNDLVFVKNMAHHLIMEDLSFLNNWINVFLIRDPKELIISFAKVIPNPSIRDIGLKKSFELFTALNEHSTILDSNELLKSPEKVLEILCQRIEIPMDSAMMQWEAGVRKEDGIWAKYWYENVHKSTGFTKRRDKSEILPLDLQPLYEEALLYYNKLYPKSIKYVAEI